jgi:hypothetical protein
MANDKKKPVEVMPPAKSGEPMKRVDIRLPQSTLERIDAIAERKGVDRAAILRQAVDEGLPAILERESAGLEYENKLLVNQKLKLSIKQLEEGANES